MQEDVLRRALGGEAEDAGRVLIESYSVPVGGQRRMMAASESRQMNAVLTRQVLFQCWVYGGGRIPSRVLGWELSRYLRVYSVWMWVRSEVPSGRGGRESSSPW